VRKKKKKKLVNPDVSLDYNKIQSGERREKRYDK